MELPVLTRRSFLGGAIALIAAPAIVRASSLMPIKVWEPEYLWLSREVLHDHDPNLLRRVWDALSGQGGYDPYTERLGGHSHLDMFVVPNSKRVRNLLKSNGLETIDAGHARYFLPRERPSPIDTLNDNAIAPTFWS